MKSEGKQPYYTRDEEQRGIHAFDKCCSYRHKYIPQFGSDYTKKSEDMVKVISIVISLNFGRQLQQRRCG